MCYYFDDIIKLEDIDDILIMQYHICFSLTITQKFNSYDSLPIGKRMTLDNVIILIKSVLNKDQNHYYHKIFLEKCSYQLAEK